MILSGTLIGFICVFALLLCALILAFLDKREKKMGNIQRANILSRVALGLFLAAFVGGVVMTLIAGIQPRKERDMATARSMARGQEPSMRRGPIIMAPSDEIDEKELRQLEEKVAGDPSDVASRERLGHLYLQQHDFENTFRMAHEVLQIRSDSAESRAHMGMVLFAMQQVDQAMNQLDLALQVDENHMETLFYKGMVQFMGQDDAKGAKATWERYLKIAKPDDPGRIQVEMFLKMIASQKPGRE